MTTTYDDIDFGAANFDEGLNLEPERAAPPIDTSLQGQDIYPPDLRSPLFMDWTTEEEQLRSASLGWFLMWRRKNPFRIIDNTGMWTFPPENMVLWNAQKERIIDWAFLEQGGLDLEKTHDLLIRRSRIRLATRPIRFAKDLPAGASASTQKETANVRKFEQSDSHRKLGERSRAQNHPERNGCRPLLPGDD